MKRIFCIDLRDWHNKSHEFVIRVIPAIPNWKMRWILCLIVHDRANIQGKGERVI